MLTRLAACAAMAAARLGELAWSRRNLSAAPADEGAASRETYPLVVALHTLAIAVTALAGGRPRWSWLALLLLVQPVRLWVLATLGRRWNARGAVPEDLDVVTGGPYRFVRHPNYAVVAVELFALPAAFGLTAFACALSLLNAALLAVRIRDEERLLARHQAWREHVAPKPRFLPRLRLP